MASGAVYKRKRNWGMKGNDSYSYSEYELAEAGSEKETPKKTKCEGGNDVWRNEEWELHRLISLNGQESSNTAFW